MCELNEHNALRSLCAVRSPEELEERCAVARISCNPADVEEALDEIARFHVFPQTRKAAALELQEPHGEFEPFFTERGFELRERVIELSGQECAYVMCGAVSLSSWNSDDDWCEPETRRGLLELFLEYYSLPGTMRSTAAYHLWPYRDGNSLITDLCWALGHPNAWLRFAAAGLLAVSHQQRTVAEELKFARDVESFPHIRQAIDDALIGLPTQLSLLLNDLGNNAVLEDA